MKKFTLLVALTWVVGCATLPTTATKVLEVAGPATLAAAKAGESIHVRALKDLADEYEAKIAAADCAADPKPPACAALVEELVAKRAALESRYATFGNAILAADTAQTAAAAALMSYLVNKEKADLLATLSNLMAVWTSLSETLAAWGVELPGIGR